MEKFGKSQSFKRSEDVRFLTGHGRYVDDIAPDGALHAILLRSPVAHATITTLDVSEAREAPGVHLVLTVDDLLAAGMDVRMDGAVLTNRDGSKAADPERPMLARGKLRHVGEPVALVVAETIDQARDAAELIELEQATRAMRATRIASRVPQNAPRATRDAQGARQRARARA